MIDVIQLFRVFESIPKADYPAKNKNLFSQWPAEIESKTGYLQDEILYLPDTLKGKIDRDKTGLIILQDIYDYDGNSVTKSCDTSAYPPFYSQIWQDNLKHHNPEIYTFKRPADFLKFEIFTMQRKENHCGIQGRKKGIINCLTPRGSSKSLFSSIKY